MGFVGCYECGCPTECGQRVHELEARVRDLEQRCSDLDVERLFWKQAADNAVRGWEKQEDVSVKLREQLADACKVGRIWLQRAQLKVEADNPAMRDILERTLAYLRRLENEAQADDPPEDRETEDTDAQG